MKRRTERVVPSAATAAHLTTMVVVFLAADLALNAVGIGSTAIGAPLKGAALLAASSVGSRVSRRFRRAGTESSAARPPAS